MRRLRDNTGVLSIDVAVYLEMMGLRCELPG